MDVGKRIKQLREQAGFTQNKLAEWAGVSQTHIRRVELGQAGITVDHLQLVCDALGCSLVEFFDEGHNSDDLSSAISALTPRQKTLLIEFLNSIKKN